VTQRARRYDCLLQGEQRFVLNRLREAMIAVEAVCPPADDDVLGKPTVEGLKQLGEAVEFKIVNFFLLRGQDYQGREHILGHDNTYNFFNELRRHRALPRHDRLAEVSKSFTWQQPSG
jgi:hypothetical protein